MFERWMWHYPAKKSLEIVDACRGVIVTVSLDLVAAYEWEPNHYRLASGLIVGMGCAMLVYHIRKGDEEDTAVKKKNVLAGIVVLMPMDLLQKWDIIM